LSQAVQVVALVVVVVVAQEDFLQAHNPLRQELLIR
jgi:hypothetical protein